MTEKIFTAKVPAKLNLSLAITGKRGNMHTLDMIVCPFDKYEDSVSFIPSDSGECGITDIRIDCDLPLFDEKKFLAGNASKFDEIAKRANVCGRLEIVKKIPIGAGMGGSSASMAAAVKAIEKYCCSVSKNIALDTRFLLSLGSDVPYMRKGGVCRVKGVGEEVETLECDALPNFESVVVSGGADSGECYGIFDKLGKDYSDLPIPKSVSDALEINRNDLFEAACIVNLSIADEVNRLKSQGIDKVFMTGSGSGLFFVKK